jgi:hypothetical protein
MGCNARILTATMGFCEPISESIWAATLGERKWAGASNAKGVADLGPGR